MEEAFGRNPIAEMGSFFCILAMARVISDGRGIWAKIQLQKQGGLLYLWPWLARLASASSGSGDGRGMYVGEIQLELLYP
jgi:hypothetical protein